MTIIVNHPERSFQIWEYSVSMRRLLLRSTKSREFESRIDVLFQNVHAVKLPSHIEGLTIFQASSAESDRISTEACVELIHGLKAFAIHTGRFQGYVISSICVMAEDSGDYSDPSDLWVDFRNKRSIRG